MRHAARTRGLPGLQRGALGVGELRVFAGRQLAGVDQEFLAHAQRQHDQAHATGVGSHDAHDLDLVEGLAQAEALEDGAAPAGHGPAHGRDLEGSQQRVHLAGIDLEAQRLRHLHLGLQEVGVLHQAPSHTVASNGRH
ncbi:hypothetical protein D3C87_1442080 [compost metagenome]